MALFKIQNQIVKKLITKDLDLEINLQSLFKNNLINNKRQKIYSWFRIFRWQAID